MKSKVLQLLKNKWAHLLFLMFLLSFVWHSGFKTYYNYGESMEPTLSSHKLLIVNTLWYDFVPIHRYDIVVVRVRDDGSYCKRVVALPNEIIEIKEGKILVNDKPLEDDPIKTTYNWKNAGISFPRTRLAGDECFYIGDNRFETVFGITSIEDVRGKVIHK